MSNTARVRSRPRHEIRLSDSALVPLGVLFGGREGATLLSTALATLPSALAQPEFAPARPWLAWVESKQTRGERNYQLRLEGDQLHPGLRRAGCQSVILALQIKEGIIRVSRQASWSTETRPELGAIASVLDRTSNRAINTLGAFAFSCALAKTRVAQGIQQRLAQTSGVQHKVHQRVRTTAGHQLAFQRYAVAPNRASAV